MKLVLCDNDPDSGPRCPSCGWELQLQSYEPPLYSFAHFEGQNTPGGCAATFTTDTNLEVAR